MLGPRQPAVAAVHQHQRRLVVGHVGVHRADHADVVDHAAAVWANSSLTSMPLWPYFWNGTASAAPRRSCARCAGWARQRLAVVLVEQRLGVERVDVRRPAVHEQVDDPLGLAGEVRRLRGQRVDVGRGRPGRGPSEPSSASTPARPSMPSPCRRGSSSRRVRKASAGQEGGSWGMRMFSSEDDATYFHASRIARRSKPRPSVLWSAL